jgi:predicted RNA-binding Zn ribbon-like protein
MADAQEFQLTAGNIALDFANAPLPDYAALLRFCEESGALTAAQTRVLTRGAPHNQKESVMREAILLRETLRKIFTPIVRQHAVASADLAKFNDCLADVLRHRKLVQRAKTFAWTWEGEGDLSSPLWPVVFAAGELLTSGQLPRVRECGDETCRWLFLDTSKNHSRRWCDMKICGNRVKARSYYRRMREAAAETQH